MFEAYLTTLLTRHFGHLLTGVSSANVRAGPFSGEVVLENVGIRREALAVLLGRGGGGEEEDDDEDDGNDDGYDDDGNDDDE